MKKTIFTWFSFLLICQIQKKFRDKCSSLFCRRISDAKNNCSPGFSFSVFLFCCKIKKIYVHLVSLFHFFTLETLNRHEKCVHNKHSSLVCRRFSDAKNNCSQVCLFKFFYIRDTRQAIKMCTKQTL
jgi:hypothetical protein